LIGGGSHGPWAGEWASAEDQVTKGIGYVARRSKEVTNSERLFGTKRTGGGCAPKLGGDADVQE